MNQVRRIVSQASRRLVLNHFLQAWSLCLTGAIVLALLARVVEKVFSFERFFAPYWLWSLIGLGALSLLVAWVWSYATRKRVIAVAQEVDERADLKEALSTALYVEKSQDPWADAVRETASRAAAGVHVPRAIPVELPRAWPIPVGAIIALLVIWKALPSFDVLGKNAVRVAQESKEKEIIQVKAQVNEQREKLKEMLAKSGVDLLDGKANDANLPDQKMIENDPDAIRRAAVKELTDLTSKLEDAKMGEKAAESDALKEAMEQLKQPGPGPMDELTRALSKGDFGAAKAALDQLSKQLSEGKMNDQQKQQMKDQAQNLSKQLESLAKNQNDLAKKLEQQGLDKKSAQDLAKKASDPAELQKALEQMKQLTPEQQKQLMQMAKASSQASEKCNNMSQSMGKMSKGMSQQGLQQEGAEGMDQMSKELNESEMMSSDMENLDAALSEAKEQLAKLGGECKKGGKCEGEGECEGSGKLGQWREGNSNKKGSGSGGPGQSNGGRSPDAQAADFQYEKKKANVNTGQGAIIGSRLVYGEQIRGESTAEFSTAIEQAEATAAEGIDSQRIPREMEGAVKAYFGKLKDKADQQAKDAPKEAPKQPK